MSQELLDARETKGLISFVIPCYRSEATLPTVVDEIVKAVSERSEYDYEIVCVDDCSPDATLQAIERLADADSRVKGVALARNGGKHAALLAGFHYVSGEYVVVLDDDGECPTSRLWKLIDPLNEGYDMSVARYDVRQVGAFKVLSSRLNNEMSHILLGKPKDLAFSNFSARKKFICDYMCKYAGPFPYLEGITLQVTRNIASVPMESRGRLAGSSGFSFKKGLALLLNGFTAYSVKPLRLPFVFAVVMLVASLSCFAFMGTFEGMVMLALAFVLGFLGVLGEYVGRTYMSLNNIPQYVVRRTYNVQREG